MLRETQAVENFKSHVNAIRSKWKISFKHVAKANSQKWKLNCIKLELSPLRLVEIRKFKDTVLEMVWERALSYTAGGSGPSDLKGSLLRAQAHTSLLSVHFSMCMLYVTWDSGKAGAPVPGPQGLWAYQGLTIFLRHPQRQQG